MTEMPIEITQGFVSSGGEDIYYESAGQGDAVIFCHGLGETMPVGFSRCQCLPIPTALLPGTSEALVGPPTVVDQLILPWLPAI